MTHDTEMKSSYAGTFDQSRVPFLAVSIIGGVAIGITMLNPSTSELILYALLFGMFTILVVRNSPYNALMMLIIWLPLQNYVPSLMVSINLGSDHLLTFLGGLKEYIVLIVGLVLVLSVRWKGLELGTVDRFAVLNVILLFCYFLVPESLLGVPNDLKTKVFGLRLALIPFLLYSLGRFAPFQNAKFYSSLRVLFVMSIAILLFGLVEVLFIARLDLLAGFARLSELKGLDPERAIESNYNYIVSYGSIQIKRMMSFFLTPLGLGYFLLLPFGLSLMLMHSRVLKKGVLRHPKTLIITIGLAQLLSVTRATIAGCVVTAAYFFGRANKSKLVLLSILLILLMLVTPLGIVWKSTIDIEDPSSIAHLFAYVYGLQSVWEHPLGIGLGQAGPVGYFYAAKGGVYGGEDASVGESLYLTVAMERGWFGLILFLGFVVKLLHSFSLLRKHSSDPLMRDFASSMIAVTIAYVLASIPTEHWFGFQSSGIYWWFAGLTVQLSQKKQTLAPQ